MANADQTIFLWINGLAGIFGPIDLLAGLLAGDYFVPVGLSLTLVAMWFAGPDKGTRQRYQLGLIVALTSMALSSLVVLIVNAQYFRPRPFETVDVTHLMYMPTDSSFPANAMAATFGMASAVWGVNRKVGTALLVAAGIYGFARVMAGVHYPLDIVGGAAIGVVTAFFVFKLRDLLMPVLVAALRLARIFCLA
ncbi:MAG: phosphatase PAP2 family protein [Chloroflexi bacterium]|nr:phosphatase PAP2 family protein [Chloroflexota bacterium]